MKGLFGKKTKEDASIDEADVDSVEQDDDTVQVDIEDVVLEAEKAEKTENVGKAAKPEKPDKKSKVKPKAEKVALKFREKQLGVKPMSGEEKRTTLARRVPSFALNKEMKVY